MEQFEENIQGNDSESVIEEQPDLIEMVRTKHAEKGRGSESLIDIFTMQLILCVLLILIFAVLKIIEAQMAECFIEKFKTATVGAPEEFLKQAVKYAVEYIK